MRVIAQGLSCLTQVLRHVAQALPNDSRLRRCSSSVWDKALVRIGCQHLLVPFAGQRIRLATRFRHWDPDYEAIAVRTWLKLVGNGDVAWDVGANIGLFTLVTARKVGSRGRVVAWEPSPRTFRILTEHVRANDLASVCEIRNAAVADLDGWLPLDESPEEADMANRIARGGSGSTAQVPVETLDSYARTGSLPPAAIKVDIEGAEVLALRGASDLLRAGAARPVLMVAVHPQFLTEFESDPEELVEIAQRHRYIWTDLTGQPAVPDSYGEFLMIPEERVERVRARMNAP